MKKLLENLRPITAYWLSVLILDIAYLAADFDFITHLNRNQLALAFFYFSFAVFCILLGRFTELKQCRVGLIVLAAQLLICPVLCIFNIFGQLAMLGNYMFSDGAPFEALFNYERSGLQYLPDYIFSIAFPSLMIFIGYRLKKLRCD